MELSVSAVHGPISPERFIDTTLELGVVLFESGAHCGRINRNVKRIADRAGFDIELVLNYSGISATVTSKKNPALSATKSRKINHYGAHFGVVTHTSLLTWQYYEEKVDFDTLENELHKTKNYPRHNIWLVRLFVGFACASLCLLSKGSYIDACFAFAAAFVGLIVKQEMINHQFNIMLANILAAFTTSMISGIDVYFSVGENPSVAVATAVLYLIPGIPLINAVIDLLEGYIPTAVARGVFGAIVLLCIAVGMFISMAIFGINNY